MSAFSSWGRLPMPFGVLVTLLWSLSCTFHPLGRGHDGGVDAHPDARPDARPDGDQCIPSVERCNGLDDDCDGVVDEETGPDEGIDHCGSCDHACPSPEHALTACEDGVCRSWCRSGWADCNDDLRAEDGDGCETDLSSNASCGGCDTVCGEGEYCRGDGSGGWACQSDCSSPLEICEGICVDTRTDPRHCGSCGNDCGEPANGVMECVGGECQLECQEGWADCNGDVGDGCEVDLRNDPAHCGSCDRDCGLPHMVTSCQDRVCQPLGCESGWADCNEDESDGCERNLGWDNSCSGCGRRCQNSLFCGCIAAWGCRAMGGPCFSACGEGELFYADDCWIEESDKNVCFNIVGLTICDRSRHCRCYSDPLGFQLCYDARSGGECWVPVR